MIKWIELTFIKNALYIKKTRDPFRKDIIISDIILMLLLYKIYRICSIDSICWVQTKLWGQKYKCSGSFHQKSSTKFSEESFARKISARKFLDFSENRLCRFWAFWPYSQGWGQKIFSTKNRLQTHIWLSEYVCFILKIFKLQFWKSWIRPWHL
jgi:hypothetical protein